MGNAPFICYTTCRCGPGAYGLLLSPHIYQACSAFELHESQDSYEYGPMHLWMMRSFYMLQCQKDEHSCHPPMP